MASLDGIPLGPVLLGLAAYHPIQKLFQTILRLVDPGFHHALSLGQRPKLDAYFVFYGGIIITSFSVPYCIDAYNSTPPDGSLTTSAQVCLGSRAVLWMSEIPPLSFSSMYLLHHVLSLSALVAGLQQAQTRVLCLISAGLVTELVSDSLCILRYHGWSNTNSRTCRALTLTNAILVVLLRAVPTLYCISVGGWSPFVLRDWVWISPLLFYAGFALRISFRQLSDLGIIQLSLQRPGYLRVGRIAIPLFSILLGVALSVTQLSTAIIYGANSSGHLSAADISSLSQAALESAAVGLFGARFLPTVLGEVVPGQKQDPPENCSKFGISIQGAIFFTAAWAPFTQTLGGFADKASFIASMALSLLLGEAIGRIGCLAAGCCGGKAAAYPPQVLASITNLGAFGWLLAAVSYGNLSLVTAGVLALGYNGAVRVVLGYIRDDSSQTSRLFSLVQLLLMAYALSLQPHAEQYAEQAVRHSMLWLPAVFAASYALLRTVYRFERIQQLLSWISQPIVFSFIAGAVMVSLAANAVFRGEPLSRGTSSRTVAKENMGQIIGSAALMSTILATGLVPVFLRQGFLDRCGP